METLVAALVPLVFLLIGLKLMMRMFLSQARGTFWWGFLREMPFY